MENKKYERKTTQTKNDIKQAFISLLEEKNFHAITVRDITSHAHINRGTFYLHYLDKYDLLEKCEQEILQQLEENAREMLPANMKQYLISDEPHPFIINIFTYFQENAPFLKVVLGPNGDPSFEEKIRKLIIQKMFKNVSDFKRVEDLNMPFEVITQFISSAIVGVIRYWLNSNMQQSPKEMANIMFQIMSKGPLEAIGLKGYILKE
ncbi:TetR/AcrR family transcriptional regulator [Lysinibacillus sp. SGAir0095]|uniref:TetR/AcrR family transcriptional regulator n=1 Tax=Lysinibacillus sp. SGAir0095 TaxID=2070463 RepID=UPI001F0F41D8|nr:TetR/AcrR family transcriptional regulator [Lysinibacillus sp. SGAir0095]